MIILTLLRKNNHFTKYCIHKKNIKNKMEIFDLKNMKVFPYEKRDKNVFCKSEKFKARIIKLEIGERIPECKMQSYVSFYVIDGEAEVIVNIQKHKLKKGQCLITEPAVLSVFLSIMAYNTGSPDK